MSIKTFGLGLGDRIIPDPFDAIIRLKIHQIKRPHGGGFDAVRPGGGGNEDRFAFEAVFSFKVYCDFHSRSTKFSITKTVPDTKKIRKILFTLLIALQSELIQTAQIKSAWFAATDLCKSCRPCLATVQLRDFL